MKEFVKNRIYHIGDNDNIGGAGSGTGSGVAALRGNDFGDWTPLPNKNTNIVDEQIDLEFKLDLVNFPDKSILYLVGQFGLSEDFVGTEITIGVLPLNTRPKHQWKEYLICQNIEFYLLIETTGEVKLSAITGNLPVNYGTESVDPYIIDLHYHPEIGEDGGSTGSYSATRTQNFTKNNCASGYAGSVVPFSKTYHSAISQADANQQKTNDAANFITEGQANANSGGSCSLIPVYTATRTANFTRNNCGSGYVGSIVAFTKEYTSLVSQVAVDAAALADINFNVEGQEFANNPANGSCSLIFTAARTANFTRNNCGDGYAGSTISFTKNYTSLVDQPTVDAIALADANFNTDGQAFANNPANGTTCTVISGGGGGSTYNYVGSGNFTRNNCGAGSNGTSVLFTKNYTSSVSLDDAIAQFSADTAFATEGQAFANLTGTCEVFESINFNMFQNGRRLRLSGLGVGSIDCDLHIVINYTKTQYDYNGENPVISGLMTTSFTMVGGDQEQDSDNLVLTAGDIININSFTFTPKYCGGKIVKINGQPGEEPLEEV